MGLYVHVPFCVHKCGYCDFNSWAEERPGPQKAWFAALQKQVSFWSKKLAGRQFETVFFGGGTPSLLSNELIQDVMKLLRASFEISPSAEITWEVNPETVTMEKLETFDRSGINRLSMGVQSFQDRNLDRLERRARRADNFKALDMIATQWKHRWSLDLMFGLPHQDLQSWRLELEEALQYKPRHLSAYQLTLTTERSKNWEQPGEDELLKQLLFTHETLERSALPFYEVSNFAAPGFECRHNLKYWNLEGFLGLGPGAAGLIPGKWLGGDNRWGFHQKNPDHFEKWEQGAGLEGAETGAWLKARDWRMHVEELLMMGLRLRKGVDSERIPGFGGVFETSDFIKNQGFTALSPEALPLLNTHLEKIFGKLDKIPVQNLDLDHLDPNF